MNLNPEQKQAVEHTGSPLVIYAGPGTGKTLVLQKKFEYLVNQGTKPHNILGITFTRSGAQELSERIARNCALHEESVSIQTFHAFALGIIRRYTQYADLPTGFKIADPELQDQLIKQVLLEKSIPFTPNHVMLIKQGISKIKKKQLSDQPEHYLEEYALNIHSEYQKRLEANAYIDYDDIITRALRVLKEPAFIFEYQSLYKYILLDEAQDTTIPQSEIICLLENPNTTIVGDQNQAIYSFAGANPEFMSEFQQKTQAKVIHLKANYRNPQSIINAANNVIKHNSNYINSELITNSETDRKIGILHSNDESQEASLITNAIQHNDLKNVTILYRRNESAKPLESALQEKGIPYSTNGIHFLDRKEINQIITIMKFTLENNDPQLFKDVMAMQTGIGKETIGKIIQEHKLSNESILRCAQKKLPGISKEKNLILFHVCGTIERIRHLSQKEQIKTIIDEIAPKPKSKNQIQNIEKFRDLLLNKNMTLDETLDFIWQIKVNPDVRLMTLHSAKGTENKTVFIIGTEEGLIPDENSFISIKAIEEERRLFYVGLTRTQETLILSNVKNRHINKARLSQSPSRFINEIPNKEFL